MTPPKRDKRVVKAWVVIGNKYSKGEILSIFLDKPMYLVTKGPYPHIKAEIHYLEPRRKKK